MKKGVLLFIIVVISCFDRIVNFNPFIFKWSFETVSLKNNCLFSWFKKNSNYLFNEGDELLLLFNEPGDRRKLFRCRVGRRRIKQRRNRQQKAENREHKQEIKQKKHKGRREKKIKIKKMLSRKFIQCKSNFYKKSYFSMFKEQTPWPDCNSFIKFIYILQASAA